MPSQSIFVTSTGQKCRVNLIITVIYYLNHFCDFQTKKMMIFDLQFLNRTELPKFPNISQHQNNAKRESEGPFASYPINSAPTVSNSLLAHVLFIQFSIQYGTSVCYSSLTDMKMRLVYGKLPLIPGNQNMKNILIFQQ